MYWFDFHIGYNQVCWFSFTFFDIHFTFIFDCLRHALVCFGLELSWWFVLALDFYFEVVLSMYIPLLYTIHIFHFDWFVLRCIDVQNVDLFSMSRYIFLFHWTIFCQIDLKSCSLLIEIAYNIIRCSHLCFIWIFLVRSQTRLSQCMSNLGCVY